MMKVIPTKEMYDDWLQHPITQLYRQLLEEWQRAIKEQWAAGAFQKEQPLETAVANAQALGELRQLKELSELDYEEFSKSFDDDEYVRATPTGSGGTG